jgi:hypothetical protein
MSAGSANANPGNWIMVHGQVNPGNWILVEETKALPVSL